MSKSIPVVEITPDGQAAEAIDLYAKRQKIYTRQTSGLFERIRTYTIAVTLGLYFILPWIRWNGQQAVLFDLHRRQFQIFGLTFWPQDFVLLAAGLIIAAFALFFITNFAGRVWCGYTCPQTVWTKIFTWCEELTEGNRQQRIKLDKTPWSLQKFRKKALKHLLWFAIALLTAYTFVGYFSSIDRLIFESFQWNISVWETFWILFFTGATYLNAGWMREQVCTYMCPYARFQGVMFDKDTLVISYDQKRGDPRGSRRRKVEPSSVGLGDCIDCHMCVQVCPTGIDIRDGLQVECIGCAACIDACDTVMDEMGYARGLVSYTTENSLNGKPSRILRPRLIAYGCMLLIMGIALLSTLFTRTPIELDILRDRNVLYRETHEGLIQNVYTLKIMNKSQEAERYQLSIISDLPFKLKTESRVTLAAGEILSYPIQVEIDPAELARTNTTFEIQVNALSNHEKGGGSTIEETRFIRP